MTCFPDRAQLRLGLMLFPELHGAKPRLTRLAHDLRTGLPVVKVAVALALDVLLLFDTQDRMLVMSLTQLEADEATPATISNEGAVRFA